MKRAPLFDGRTGVSLRHVFLYPGTLHCKRQPSVVTTVLGSCVAVCLTDRSRSISGINHFMLPRGGKDSADLRHGDSAIAALLARMLRLGSRVEDIEAKIFGGGAVLPVSNPEAAVGSKNVAVALECLHGLDIAVIARRTGGKSGMVVRLFTATGDVLVRKSPPRANCRTMSRRSSRGAGYRPDRLRCATPVMLYAAQSTRPGSLAIVVRAGAEP